MTKNNGRIIAGCLFALGILASFAQSTVVAQAQPNKAAWTLILYLAADCNLERAIMDNLEEALIVGSTRDVNVVVLADRHPDSSEIKLKNPLDEDGFPLFSESEIEKKRRYTNRDIGGIENWSGVKVFFVEKGSLTEVEDLGDVSTGDARTLESFLRLVVAKYPAQRYGLVVGGHGNAWKKVCPDESADHEAINMLPFRQAIIKGLGQKLEFLGFDACLMANFEVLHALEGLTAVVVASEESSPGDGWNYATLLRTVAKDPAVDGMKIGRSMGEAFYEYFAKADRGSLRSATFSVIDMSQFKGVVSTLQDLAVLLDQQLEQDSEHAWAKIAHSAAKTTEYGEAEDERDVAHLFDLAGFAQQIAVHFEQPAIRAAAEGVVQSIREAVVFEKHGSAREGSHGITIYLPHRQRSGLETALQDYQSLPSASEHAWFKVISREAQISETHIAHTLLGELSVAKEQDVFHLTAEVLDIDEFDTAQFVVVELLDGKLTFKVIDRDPIDFWEIEPDRENTLSTPWDGDWFYIQQGNRTLACPVIEATIEEEDGEDAFYIDLPVQIAQAQDEWEFGKLTFYYNQDTDEYEYAFADCYDEGEIFEVDLVEGDRIRFLEWQLNADEELEIGVQESSVIEIEDVDDLRIVTRELAADQMTIGYLCENTVGEVQLSLFDASSQDADNVADDPDNDADLAVEREDGDFE